MLTRDEEKALRLKFWIEFDHYSSGIKRRKKLRAGWIMNNTGIRQLKLKFDISTDKATVGIDVQTRNLDKRIDIFGKLERMKSLFEKKMGQALVWELDHPLSTGGSVSRVCLELNDVSIFREEEWSKIFVFFYQNMLAFEELFLEYREYLKYTPVGD